MKVGHARPPRRILALHGWCQSADKLKGVTKDLRRFLAVEGFELVYADAPTLVPPPRGGGATGAGQPNTRAWWVYNADDPTSCDGFLDNTYPDGYPFWHRSVAALRSLEAEAGPFAGVLGFSQGATAAHLLLATQPLERPLRFGLLVAGFPARCPEAAGTLRVPTVHVSGRADDRVPPAYQHELAARFARASVCVHDKAHSISLPKPVLRDVVARLGAAAAEAEAETEAEADAV